MLHRCLVWNRHHSDHDLEATIVSASTVNSAGLYKSSGMGVGGVQGGIGYRARMISSAHSSGNNYHGNDWDDVLSRRAGGAVGLSLREHVEAEARNKPTEAFARYMRDLYRRILRLINSPDLRHRLGGVYAIDQLTDAKLGENVGKINRFATYLRDVMTPTCEPQLAEAASRALGHLVSVGGALTADIVDMEVKRSIAWLSDLERVEARRYAAVLILRELARNAPTVFNVHVPAFIDAIWPALRDQSLVIREAAVRVSINPYQNPRPHPITTQTLTNPCPLSPPAGTCASRVSRRHRETRDAVPRAVVLQVVRGDAIGNRGFWKVFWNVFRSVFRGANARVVAGVWGDAATHRRVHAIALQGSRGDGAETAREQSELIFISSLFLCPCGRCD